MSNPKEPVKVAEHKDINDDGQTVLITEHISQSILLLRTRMARKKSKPEKM